MQLTKVLATAWAVDNIQVNAVLPGWIDTELTQGARKQIEGLHDSVLKRTPAGRWGAIEDMAGVAVFLAGPALGFRDRDRDPGGWGLFDPGMTAVTSRP